ncbi:transcriptional regulator [Luteibacter sp. 621]|uniref:FMN-binding negative transcriptional regulator n=1 Tax=Luteibacter sp. 621 TaxID=3373916 RepID=UPI003D2507C4
MYVPALFTESDPAVLHRFVREHPLGMLVTHTAAGLDANHVPFLLDEARGGSGVLVAHVARANTVWRDVADGDDVLIVFRGAHGYISPNWYPSKQETHRHVPTWNYEVVHAHGRIRVIDDEKYVRGVVARLTREHEARLPEPWKMSDAPADYLAEELAHIVGIEVEITRLKGKRKLSQNRTSGDFEGAVNGVEGSGNLALANAMRASRTPKD